MIGRVYRDAQVGGLLRYLYGPGRHKEHENPHLIAAWDLESAAELATLEPLVLSVSGAPASRDFGPMTRSMELATAFRAPSTSQKVIDRQVWHCPLRVAAGDRALTDVEWAQVARDVMHRTGIARHGDDGGCRWVAVRHDEHSVHLVAVLARQDGRAARLSNDYRRVREACLAAEQMFGLSVTAPADRTAATHVTRAEVEKTARTAGEGALPARVWLREQVQLAATWASSPTEFLDGLRAAGVLVRERRDEGGGLTGYAVARTSPDSQRGTGKDEPVFYGGGKLAPDLTLPKLVARWPASGGRGAAVAGPGAAVILQKTAQALPRAARLVRAQAALPEPGRVAAVDDLAAAHAELLRAVAFRLEGEAGGPVTRGGRAYARASRASGGRPAAPTVAGAFLREAAQQLLRTSKAGSTQGDWTRVLVQALDLVAAVAELRRAQRYVAQAAAARRAAHHLGEALRPASAAQELRAALIANTQGSDVVAAAARRPSPVQQPTQGRGRR